MAEGVDPVDTIPSIVSDLPNPPPESAQAAPAAPSAPAGGSPSLRAWLIGAALVGAASVAAVTVAVFSQQRIKALEQELVKRQQDSQSQAVEARAMAKHAQDAAISAETRIGLLEGRVAETALQRSQLEELIQQLSRSRDENVLADVEASIRVAVQQVAITGSAEPLVAALKQAEERLARVAHPRVERVRRALLRDLDRVRAVAVTDIANLAIRLDEAVRMVDDLPLLSQPERRAAATAQAPARAASRPASGPAAPASPAWLQALASAWSGIAERVWGELRSLVRVTRIDQPEAMLVAPDQGWFLRENLKLRLLNARLALLSRQFDTVQADLREARSALDRYFDRGSRRVTTASELIRQVAQMARQVSVPRPDESLAAIAAAQAGR